TPEQASLYGLNQNLTVKTLGYPVEGTGAIYVAPDNTFGPAACIGPDNQNLDDDSGYYDYTTTFDLTGLDPTTAVINGRLSADDETTQVYLNGNLLPITATGYVGGSGYVPAYTFLTPFSIDSGYVAGVNTLDFRVFNNPDYLYTPPADDPNPTGLLVEMSGTATASIGDTGASSAILLAGAAGLLLWSARRRPLLQP